MARDLICPRTRRRPAAVVVVLAALALGGCGAGAGAGATSSTTVRRSSGRRTTTTTTSPTTTTSAATTTAAALPGTGKPAVTIGDKNYTEQFVLGQLYLQALKAQGFRVSLNPNIGPPDVVRGALENGSLAMYPDYLDVFEQTIAGDRRDFRSKRAAYAAARAWARRHGLRLLAPTPFSDTSAVAVTDAYATTHHLRTLGDLSHVDSQFVAGGAVQFEDSSPGLPTLADVYGVTPLSFHAVAVGSQYADLDAGTVQAAFINTTDGELSTGDYRVLADPRRIFGVGNVVPVVTRKTLVREGPAFAATIERVDRTLTQTAMRVLNNAADETGANAASVATQYLQTHGLLSPLPASTPKGATATAPGASGGSR